MPPRNPQGKPDESNGLTRLPLSGLTVVDLTRALAGPTCTRHLADWGADVISVHQPGAEAEDVSGNRDISDFQNLHRNKRTISIDLKSPEGHAVFMRLVNRADVLVENMRPSVKHRLKIAWEDVHAVNPRLVYASVSGFGQDGPYADRAGVDQIAQGMGGLMSVTGEPGQGPMRVGVPIADLSAGNLMALGVMMALFERQTTGTGRWVQTSLLEAQLFMLEFQATRWLIDRKVPPQAGNNHPIGTPTGVFPTSDGHINIAAASTRIWYKTCDALGHSEWKDRQSWKRPDGRLKDRPEINRLISDITRQRPSAHWVDLLNRNGVPCGPIYSIDQTFADPHVQHLGMARPVQHPRLGELSLVASPLNFSGHSKDIRHATHDAGADTEAVLRELGYGNADIAALRSKNIV